MHCGKYRLPIPGWVLLCLFFSIGSLNAQSIVSKEYKIKAVFLFNFTQFVAWPDKSFENDRSRYILMKKSTWAVMVQSIPEPNFNNSEHDRFEIL